MSTQRKKSRTTKKPTQEEKFKEWSEHLDIEFEIIQGRYNTILGEKVKAFPELPEKVLVPSVTRILQGNLKRDFGSLISKAVPVRGFFVGASELVDFIDRMRQKALRESGENEEAFEKAKAEGMINASGEPLDTREKLFGRDLNPTYGRPLDEVPEKQVIQSHRRTLYGVGYPKGSELARFFSVDFHAEMAINLEYSLYEPVTWRANIIKDGLHVLQRASEAATRIRSIDMGFDKIQMVEEACEMYELSEIEQWHGQNYEDWDRVICSKGTSAVISDRPHPATNSTMIIFDDESLGFEDMGHRGYVPDYLPIDFGEDTDIIFWGRTGTQELRATEERIVVTNIFGMFPYGEMITPAGYRSGKKIDIDWDDADE